VASKPNHHINFKNIVKALAIPFTLLILSASYHIAWKLLDLPDSDALIVIVGNFFNNHGVWVVLVCSVLESALVVGNYFPDSIVIFLGVISAGHNISRIILVVSVVCVGFFIGYILDYLLGRYGWYKLLIKFGMAEQLKKTQTKVAHHSFKAIILSYWEVNLASLTATAAGILKMNFYKFLLESAIALVIWNIFWGILVASLGKRALDLITNWVYVLPAIAVSVIIIINEKLKKENIHEHISE